MPPRFCWSLAPLLCPQELRQNSRQKLLAEDSLSCSEVTGDYTLDAIIEGGRLMWVNRFKDGTQWAGFSAAGIDPRGEDQSLFPRPYGRTLMIDFPFFRSVELRAATASS